MSDPRPTDPGPIDSAMTRHAGPIALAAGASLVATDLGRYPLVGNRLALATNPALMAVNAAYFFAFVGLVAALVAVHGRLGPRMGRFGLLAFLVALVGTVTQAGNMWFDGFVAPWLAQVLPQAFSTPKTVILLTGALLSYLLVALGWVLYGLALLRARTVPVAVALALVVGGLFAYGSGMTPYGVPLGLAIAVLGGVLVRTDRAAARPATV